MQVKSLGYRTDLFFSTFDGITTDRGEYLVIQTPANPDFYWGNYLIFANPPGKGDLDRWRGLFAREIGSPPAVKHQVFGWDSPRGDLGEIDPFLSAGFRLVQSVVLTSHAPRPPARLNESIAVRPLQSENDWAQTTDNQVACREADFSEADYRTFKQPQMARYRRMQAAGLGHWYGAFLADRLVADLGIFHQEGLARFQSVGTHPDFRRQGIAALLVYHSSLLAIQEFKLHTLVIVAEQDSSPARIYQSVGFEMNEKQVGLEWWPGIQNV
jgi:GNAT superfamily N-acetyltransferase